MLLQCYLHTIYNFASFIGYENNILEVISNLNVQWPKFGGKKDKLGGKYFLKLNSAEFMEFIFSKFAYRQLSDAFLQSYWRHNLFFGGGIGCWVNLADKK